MRGQAVVDLSQEGVMVFPQDAGGVIDLTGPSPPASPRREARPPPQGGGVMIDLTLDNGDDDDDDMVVPFVPPVPFGSLFDMSEQRRVNLLRQADDLRQVRERLRELERIQEAARARPLPPPRPPAQRVVPGPRVLAPRPLVLPQEPAARGRKRGRPPAKKKVERAERQAVAENSCPICMEEFTSERGVQWCKYGCGGNVHTACLTKWKSSRSRIGSKGKLLCILCRAPWNG